MPLTDPLDLFVPIAALVPLRTSCPCAAPRCAALCHLRRSPSRPPHRPPPRPARLQADLAIQVCLICFFVPVFPVMMTIFCGQNILEVRGALFRMMNQQTRPIPISHSHVKAWETVLDFVTGAGVIISAGGIWVSMVSNSELKQFAVTFVDDNPSWSSTMLLMICVERIFSWGRSLYEYNVGDGPLPWGAAVGATPSAAHAGANREPHPRSVLPSASHPPHPASMRAAPHSPGQRAAGGGEEDSRHAPQAPRAKPQPPTHTAHPNPRAGSLQLGGLRPVLSGAQLLAASPGPEAGR